MTRAPWNDSAKVSFLIKWWKHFGTHVVARELGLTRIQVKGKADKLGLKMLPKPRRLCAICRRRRQKTRSQGSRCRICHLDRRKEIRRGTGQTLEQWIALATNTARHRSKTKSNLTAAYMVKLWRKQGGRCAYTGAELRQPEYKRGRDRRSPSIDRIDSSKGYVRGNVAWVSWGVNYMKSDLPMRDFVEMCSAVARHGDVLLKLAAELEFEFTP